MVPPELDEYSDNNRQFPIIEGSRTVELSYETESDPDAVTLLSTGLESNGTVARTTLPVGHSKAPKGRCGWMWASPSCPMPAIARNLLGALKRNKSKTLKAQAA